MLLGNSDIGLILVKISANAYHLYFIWEWIQLAAESSFLSKDSYLTEQVQVQIMARIVLTLAAVIFLYQPTLDHDLWVSSKSAQYRKDAADSQGYCVNFCYLRSTFERVTVPW
jgi:hypothetical protein